MSEQQGNAEKVAGLAEPPRWSVVWTKSDDTTWINVGRNYELDGSWWSIWVSTHMPNRVAKWAEMDVACILAWGLDEPIPPGQSVSITRPISSAEPGGDA